MDLTSPPSPVQPAAIVLRPSEQAQRSPVMAHASSSLPAPPQRSRGSSTPASTPPLNATILHREQLPMERKRPASLSGRMAQTSPPSKRDVATAPQSFSGAGPVQTVTGRSSSSIQTQALGHNAGQSREHSRLLNASGLSREPDVHESVARRIQSLQMPEERPQKRPRLENEVVGTNGLDNALHGPGQGASHQGSTPRKNLIDLTNGEDDDEVVVISDSLQKSVCYGQINARIHAHMVPTPSPTAKSFDQGHWPAIKVELKRGGPTTYLIHCVDPMRKDFGNLDTSTAYGLSQLMDAPYLGLRLQAKIPTRRRIGLESQAGLPTSTLYDILITLYGRKASASQVGNFLLSRQVYLRQPRPGTLDAGYEVHNPHQNIKLPEAKVASLKPVAGNVPLVGPSPGAGIGYALRSVEEVNSDVLGMFDNLENSETMPEMDPSPLVKTPLLKHQKQALYFMTSKEKNRTFGDKEEDNNSLWRIRSREGGVKQYYNIISCTFERATPPEVRGGILADMMGLGKTLSILSLVLSSMKEAVAWSKTKVPKGKVGDLPLLRNSKGTLLVCPLSTLANWEEQIKAHLEENAITYYIYHGASRVSRVDALCRFDLVITTYSTAGGEFEKKPRREDAECPLMQTQWFRVVLDEAHIIRGTATKQSRAMCALAAQRRWAVTGTPIQNSLSDLGALIKFLRIRPFDDKGGFANSFTNPLKNAAPMALEKLQLLVRSITLRRLKDRIDLPPRQDLKEMLTFSEEEQSLYSFFEKDSASKVDIVAGEGRTNLRGKVFVHILRAILRLRLICAHGKELLGDEDLKMMQGASQVNAINLDEVPDHNPDAGLSSRTAYDNLNLMRESNTDMCSMCNAKAGPRDGSAEDGSDSEDEPKVLAFMTWPCIHLLCRDCFPKFKSEIPLDWALGPCPICQNNVQMQWFEIRRAAYEEYVESISAAREKSTSKKLGRYHGPHTKTKVLTRYLLESQAWNEHNPAERPLKSVVFSGWTSHLDLIEIALKENKIRFTRLDGRMKRAQRNAALATFREDDSVAVILVSIGAGGLGLNLTAGSRIYVMEPQFNPAAEAQAIDRVHRLGQTREVTTIRFIMKDSFEERMLELQRRKQNLADLGLGAGKLDKSEALQKKLEDLRSLFK